MELTKRGGPQDEMKTRKKQATQLDITWKAQIKSLRSMDERSQLSTPEECPSWIQPKTTTSLLAVVTWQRNLILAAKTTQTGRGMYNVGYLGIIAPRNFTNCAAEFGKVCRGKTVALLLLTFHMQFRYRGSIAYRDTWDCIVIVVPFLVSHNTIALIISILVFTVYILIVFNGGCFDFWEHLIAKMPPQVFRVIRCYNCGTFQVEQVKKSNKWKCKLCGEAQSLKKVVT